MTCIRTPIGSTHVSSKPLHGLSHRGRCLVSVRSRHPLHGTSSLQGALPPPDQEQDAAALRLRDAVGIQHWQYQAYIKPVLSHFPGDQPGPYVEATLAVLLSISSRDRVQALLLAHPELLTRDDLPAWAQFFSSYGVSTAAFFSLLASHSQLFTQRGGLYLAGLSLLFLSRLGFSHRDLASCVIPMHAELLSVDPGSVMQPVLDFLEHELGIAEAAKRLEVVAKCPQLLSLSVDRQLRPRVAFLENLGLRREEVCTLTRVATSLLLSDPQPQLTRVLTFLTSKCGLDRERAVRVVAACPSAVTLSTANLTQKWDFLVSQIHGGAADLEAFPGYLSCILLYETAPRFYFARECKALGRFHTCALPGTDMRHSSLNLRQLLDCPLPEYLAVVGSDEERFLEFRYHWLVSHGRRWSGKVSVIPDLAASASADAGSGSGAGISSFEQPAF